METTRIEKSFDLIARKTNVLAYLFLAIGLFGLSGYLIYGNAYALTFPLAAFLGSIYFLIYKRFDKGSIQFSYLNLSSKKVLLLTCLYISLVSITFLTYHQSGFNRTLLVHGLTISLYVITCIFIFSNVSYKYSLSLIILTGFIHRILMYYSSPTYIGIDVHRHNQLVGSIIEARSLLPPLHGNKYYFAPFYHIYSAAGSIILSVSIRTVMLIVIFNLVLIPAMFIFLIVKKLWDTRMGLLAGLFYISADAALEWNMNLGPTSLGVLFSVIVFLMLFKYLDNKSIRYYFIFFLFLIALTYTHQVATFITLIAITTYVGFFSILDYSHSLRKNIVIFITTPLIVFFDFIRTDYSSDSAREISFFDRVTLGIIESLEGAGAGTRAEFILPEGVIAGGAASLTPIHTAGSAILIGLSVLGILYVLHSDIERTKKVKFTSIFVTAFVLVAITLAGPMIGMRNLMPFRWFAFFYIFLVIVGIVALSPMLNNIKKLSRNDIAIVLVIFILIVPYLGLMGGNRTGASDDPLFDSAPGAVRWSIYDGEDALFWHTSNYRSENTTVLSDFRMGDALQSHYKLETSSIIMEYDNPNSIAKNRDEPVLLINSRSLNTPQNTYIMYYDNSTARVHGPINVEEMDSGIKNIIYDCGQDQLVLLKS